MHWKIHLKQISTRGHLSTIDSLVSNLESPVLRSKKFTLLFYCDTEHAKGSHNSSPLHEDQANQTRIDFDLVFEASSYLKSCI